MFVSVLSGSTLGDITKGALREYYPLSVVYFLYFFIVSLMYKPLIRKKKKKKKKKKIKPFKDYLKSTFLKNKSACKTMYLVDDFNLNVLEYKINKKNQNFFDLIFQHGLIPIINKPTRVIKPNATAIDHIITNTYLSSNLKTGIIKTDISDHFPIFLVSETPGISIYPLTTTIFERYINDKSIKQFNLLLNEVNWNNVLQRKCSNKAYEFFLETFLCLYEKAIPKVNITIKTKSLLSPWMTKGLLK